MLKIIMMTTIALSLSGCIFTPKYEKPKSVIDENMLLKSGNTGSTSSLVDILAHDPILTNIIHNALINNYDLQQGMIKVQSSILQTNSATLDYIPAVAFGASKNISMTRQISPFDGSAVQQKSKSYQSSLSLNSYEVDIWGRKFNEIMSLNDQRKASESAVAAIRLTLISELSRNWYELKSLIKSWHLMSAKLSRLNEIETTLKEIDSLGRIDPVSIAKFSRGKANDESYSLTLEKEISTRINKIEYLSGMYPIQINAINWKTESGDYRIPLVNQSISSKVIFNRPDVIQAEMNITAANGTIGAARASLLPVFNLFANATHTSSSFDNILGNLTNNWTLTPSMVIPIFSLPKNYSNLKLADKQKSLAVIEYKNTVAQALMDIKDSISEVDVADKISQSFSAEVVRSKQQMEKIDFRYRAGYGDIYSLYESVDIFHSAQLELENARRQKMSNTLILLKSMGG
ncbi:TolC family protein [Pantoea sp. B9002]|uniref:TolC family protein n=1 Tax=Pantoea sp. B9002 TaxID=2726979 RepID=UPI00159FB128|nr:TolC family protein [Pantoea sp. B9002]NWA62801.1 TolC family protein [Pantoea sp. B9002]